MEGAKIFPPKSLIRKNGFDEAILFGLCELIGDRLSTKVVPLIGKRSYTKSQGKSGTVGNEREKATGLGTSQKKDRESKPSDKQIKFVRMDIIAAMVLGNPKHKN